MKAIGQLQPILLRGSSDPAEDKYVLIEGARRLLAAELLRWEFIEALIEEAELSKTQMLQRTMIANIQREDFTPVEKARGIRELMENSKWDATTVAKELGITSVAVSRSLALLTLPESILSQVEAGIIPAASAVGLTRIEDVDVQKEFAIRAAAGQVTRDDIEAAAKALRKSRPKANTSAVKRVTIVVSDKMSITFTGESLSMEICAEGSKDLLALFTKFRGSMGLAVFAQMLLEQNGKSKS